MDSQREIIEGVPKFSVFSVFGRVIALLMMHMFWEWPGEISTESESQSQLFKQGNKTRFIILGVILYVLRSFFFFF